MVDKIWQEPKCGICFKNPPSYKCKECEAIICEKCAAKMNYNCIDCAPPLKEI